MKRKMYFYLSILIALALPILFGLIYNNGLEKNKSIKNYNIKAHPEIIFTNGNVINNLEDVSINEEDYLSASFFDFNVTYTKGEELMQIYNLILSNINITNLNALNKINFKLFKKDENEKYIEINSGKLDNQKEIIIASDLPIALNNIQNYRLYYWINYEDSESELYLGTKLTATINLS